MKKYFGIGFKKRDILANYLLQTLHQAKPLPHWNQDQTKQKKCKHLNSFGPRHLQYPRVVFENL